MKYVTLPIAVALAVGIVAGYAYGSKIPGVPTLARALPGHTSL